MVSLLLEKNSVSWAEWRLQARREAKEGWKPMVSKLLDRVVMSRIFDPLEAFLLVIIQLSLVLTGQPAQLTVADRAWASRLFSK